MMASNLTTPLSLDCDSFNYDIIDVSLSCLYFLMFPLALLLNGVAAWVCLHLRSTSTFIVYLKNLVIADLLMTLTIPVKAAGKLPGSSLGLQAFICRYSSVIFFSCMYMSITLMGLISLDRFFKIVRPSGKLLGQNLVFSIVMSVSGWVMLFGGIAFPTMILTNESATNVTEHFCMLMKSPTGLTFHKFVVIFMDALFWVVSVLVVVCYICITNKVLQSFRNSGSNNSQGKRKTKLRVFLVLVVFLVCFVPFHIVRIPYTLHEIKEDTCTVTWVMIANDVALYLSTTSICLDPLLYVFLCREFNEKLMDMIKHFPIAWGSTENTSE